MKSFIILTLFTACTNSGSNPKGKIPIPTPAPTDTLTKRAMTEKIGEKGALDSSEVKDSQKEDFTDNYKKKQPFEVIKATSQNWSGGAAGSGGGTNYSFKIKIITKKTVTFEKVWVDKHALDINKIGEGKDLTLSAQYQRPGEVDRRIWKEQGKNPEEMVKEDLAPISFSGDALIRYKIEGKIRYYVVKKVEKLDPLHYP